MKHNIYILLHACWATVQLLHFWADWWLSSNKLFYFSNPLHRIEFGPPKFFSKTFRFSMIFYSTLQIFGGGHFQKACRFEKKNRNSRKSHANSRNLLEPFLRSRKEDNLYGHCAINNARRIISKGDTGVVDEIDHKIISIFNRPSTMDRNSP